MADTTHQAKCLRCHRKLTAAKSIADGYGRSCRTKVKAAAKAEVVAQFKPALVAKAEELIEQGAIIPLRGRRVFQVVASNGVDRYLSAPQSCNCPAGLRARHACYHRIAAAIFAAA